MRKLIMAILFCLPFSTALALDAHVKFQFQGTTLRMLELDLHYSAGYIALHGTATLAGTLGNYGPVTGTCAFQSELTLFCNTDFGVSGVLFLTIHFEEDEEEGGVEIQSVSYHLPLIPSRLPGESGEGTLIAYEEFSAFQPQKLYLRWQMSAQTGVNADLTTIEMDVETSPRFLILYGKATRQGGVFPFTGTCISEDDGDFYCVTDYRDSGDNTMLLRPSGNTALMSMRSFSASGVESGRAIGTLVELR